MGIINQEINTVIAWLDSCRTRGQINSIINFIKYKRYPEHVRTLLMYRASIMLDINDGL